MQLPGLYDLARMTNCEMFSWQLNGFSQCSLLKNYLQQRKKTLHIAKRHTVTLGRMSVLTTNGKKERVCVIKVSILHTSYRCSI